MDNIENNQEINIEETENKNAINNELNDIMSKLEEELVQEKEKSMRIQAEMINFRKRKEDEVASIKKYANEEILKKLLLVIDNFERALSFETEENKEFLKGFSMIYTNIVNILNENEVKEIDAKDQIFDPAFHQAVLTEKSDSYDEGIVMEVLQKGYTYKDRVLRPAMVKVSE